MRICETNIWKKDKNEIVHTYRPEVSKRISKNYKSGKAKKYIPDICLELATKKAEGY